MCRLRVGVLYILWLHMGQGPRSPQVPRAVHSALQDLIEKSVGTRRNPNKAVIISLSTAGTAELDPLLRSVNVLTRTIQTDEGEICGFDYEVNCPFNK